jgi:hypothetical protein
MGFTARIHSWIRGRLRHILRFRDKRQGLCRGGLDHQRYPNAFFENLGLISLYALAGTIQLKVSF